MIFTTERVPAFSFNTYQFTVEQYIRMGELGILAPNEQTELIEGEILTMSPIGTKHAGSVNRLNRLLNHQLGDVALIAPQNPVQLSDRSQPQPDFAILKFRDDDYTAAHPTAIDIFALIEVSDSTLQYDRTVKLPLYAQAGIPEVWIVNLELQVLEVYRSPSNDVYQDIKEYKPGETIVFTAFPERVISVAEIFAV